MFIEWIASSIGGWTAWFIQVRNRSTYPAQEKIPKVRCTRMSAYELPCSRDIIEVVPAGLWRPIVALAVVPWLVCASVMPREHLHQADADRPNSLIHRHVEAHPLESHHHGGAEVGHDEERVVWLSDDTVVQATYHFHVSWAVVGPIVETSPDTASWSATVSHDGSPPHGPPRPYRSPRAPPHTSA